MALPMTRRGLALGAAALAALPRIARAADDTIKIGVMTPLTGPAVESGRMQQNGIKIALDAVNQKGVLGRKLEIVTEDDQTTNPGATQGFERLASRPDIAAIIGPIRSAQVNAIEAGVRKLGKPFMFGGTDPTLTQRGNPWLFRCRPNDSYSATIIAEFGFGQLQKQKWAVVSSAEAFGINGSKALQAALRERSITPLTMQSFPNQTTDFTAVVDAVRASGADVLSTYIALETDLGVFAQHLQRAGLNLPWVGSPSITSPQSRTFAGEALFGSFGIADFALDGTPTSGVFGAKYNALFGTIPDHQAAYAHDAVLLLARAMTDANGTEPAKVQEALLAIKGFAAAEGEYNFDDKGDGLRGYNIVKNEKGKIVFDRRIEVEPT
jgi:branched-chain amino acid transport system substrate-binding protein